MMHFKEQQKLPLDAVIILSFVYLIQNSTITCHLSNVFFYNSHLSNVLFTYLIWNFVLFDMQY